MGALTAFRDGTLDVREVLLNELDKLVTLLVLAVLVDGVGNPIQPDPDAHVAVLELVRCAEFNGFSESCNSKQDGNL